MKCIHPSNLTWTADSAMLESMNYCLFLLAQDIRSPRGASAMEPLCQLHSVLRNIPGLTQWVSHWAIDGVGDPAIRESAGPDQAFQLYFDDLLCLESVLL